MKDQNGLKLKAGDEVVYCGDLFQIAGEHEGRAIIWPTDPGLCGELIVVESQLIRVHEPMRGFWRWLKSFVLESVVPEASGERVTIAHT